MSDVYVVGIDMIRFGRYPDRTVVQLAAEAALGALDDCGIAIGDVQALYSGNIGETMTGQRTLQLIGQTGIPVVNCTNACATGATALREGWTAIKAGLYDVVLCIGVEKMQPGMIVKKKVGNEPLPVEGLIGSETMPAVFAMMGMEHARKYGTTLEQFAKVSVKNHHHSTFNPKAMYQKETPLEEVMNAEMIAYPNTKLMCSVNVDGAAAAVLMSAKKARELGPRTASRESEGVGPRERRVVGAQSGDAGCQYGDASCRENSVRNGWYRSRRTASRRVA